MLKPLGLHHGDALEAFLSDFDDEPGELHGYFCDRNWSIDRVVSTHEAWSRGELLPTGWIPCSTWFWEAEGVLKGIVNIRHHLTPALQQAGGHIGYAVAPRHRRRGVATVMLRGALIECRKLGIERALLTVDADNVASWKTIERNGGILVHEGRLDDVDSLRRWYRIDTGS